MQHTSKAEMKTLYRKAFTSVISANPFHVSVNIEAKINNNELDFGITVFEPETLDNITFRFYDWQRKEEITKNLNEAINLIKTDDFAKIKAGITDMQEEND